MQTTVLFTARQAGQRPYTMWLTPGDAERRRQIYERAGWMVTLENIREEEL